MLCSNIFINKQPTSTIITHLELKRENITKTQQRNRERWRRRKRRGMSDVTHISTLQQEKATDMTGWLEMHSMRKHISSPTLSSPPSPSFYYVFFNHILSHFFYGFSFFVRTKNKLVKQYKLKQTTLKTIEHVIQQVLVV